MNKHCSTPTGISGKSTALILFTFEKNGNNINFLHVFFLVNKKEKCVKKFFFMTVLWIIIIILKVLKT